MRALGLVVLSIAGIACSGPSSASSLERREGGAGSDAAGSDSSSRVDGRESVDATDETRGLLEAGRGSESGAGNDGGGSKSDAGPPQDGGKASPCDSIAPSPTASTNRQTIQNCLDTVGRAYLSAGTFPIDTGLTLAQGVALKGLGSTPPTIRLVGGGAATDCMVNVNGGTGAGQTTISNLNIDANAALSSSITYSTIKIGSDNATIDSVAIYNGTQVTPSYQATGVYFVCQSCSGNVVSNSKIYNHFRGVIFRSTLTKSTPNRVISSDIHDILCDAFTLAGYGEVVGNTIHDSGWDCGNGPIPAAGCYCLANAEGALIDSNTIWDTCGHGLDIDSCSNFVISNNHIHDPGYQFGGAYAYCGGAAAAFLLDTSDSTITNNDFENAGNTNDTGADPNHVTNASGGAAFSDYPGGSKTSVAFVLAKRPSGTTYWTTNNQLTGNTFRSNQIASGYVGMGLFTSRGTGYVNGQWSASTTNYFTGNVTFGSNVGSKRCGGDWFAGNSTCAQGSAAPCNDDDYQHTGMYHSDGCAFY